GAVHRGAPGRTPARRLLASPASVRRRRPVRLRAARGVADRLRAGADGHGPRAGRTHPAAVARPLLGLGAGLDRPALPPGPAGPLRVRVAPVGAGLLPDRLRPRAGVGGDAVGGPGLHLEDAVRAAAGGDRGGPRRPAHRPVLVPRRRTGRPTP